MYKFFGIPLIKKMSYYDPKNVLEEEEKKKFNSFPLKKMTKACFIVLGTILMLLSVFILGIYTANTYWFNDLFYIESRQMADLNIRSLRQYNNDLYNKAISQYDMNVASNRRYEHYHQYYEKVVERLSQLQLDEVERSALDEYINGYKQRKAQMEYVMFPYLHNESIETSYGTRISSVYPSAMLEFDRQELLTLKMILQNMYASYLIDDIDSIFKE